MEKKQDSNNVGRNRNTTKDEPFHTKENRNSQLCIESSEDFKIEDISLLEDNSLNNEFIPHKNLQYKEPRIDAQNYQVDIPPKKYVRSYELNSSYTPRGTHIPMECGGPGYIWNVCNLHPKDTEDCQKFLKELFPKEFSNQNTQSEERALTLQHNQHYNPELQKCYAISPLRSYIKEDISDLKEGHSLCIKSIDTINTINSQEYIKNRNLPLYSRIPICDNTSIKNTNYIEDLSKDNTGENDDTIVLNDSICNNNINQDIKEYKEPFLQRRTHVPVDKLGYSHQQELPTKRRRIFVSSNRKYPTVEETFLSRFSKDTNVIEYNKEENSNSLWDCWREKQLKVIKDHNNNIVDDIDLQNRQSRQKDSNKKYLCSQDIENTFQEENCKIDQEYIISFILYKDDIIKDTSNNKRIRLTNIVIDDETRRLFEEGKKQSYEYRMQIWKQMVKQSQQLTNEEQNITLSRQKALQNAIDTCTISSIESTTWQKHLLTRLHRKPTVEDRNIQYVQFKRASGWISKCKYIFSYRGESVSNDILKILYKESEEQLPYISLKERYMIKVLYNNTIRWIYNIQNKLNNNMQNINEQHEILESGDRDIPSISTYESYIQRNEQREHQIQQLNMLRSIRNIPRSIIIECLSYIYPCIYTTIKINTLSLWYNTNIIDINKLINRQYNIKQYVNKCRKKWYKKTIYNLLETNIYVNSMNMLYTFYNGYWYQQWLNMLNDEIQIYKDSKIVLDNGLLCYNICGTCNIIKDNDKRLEQLNCIELLYRRCIEGKFLNIKIFRWLFISIFVVLDWCTRLWNIEYYNELQELDIKQCEQLEWYNRCGNLLPQDIEEQDILKNICINRRWIYDIQKIKNTNIYLTQNDAKKLLKEKEYIENTYTYKYLYNEYKKAIILRTEIQCALNIRRKDNNNLIDIPLNDIEIEFTANNYTLEYWELQYNKLKNIKLQLDITKYVEQILIKTNRWKKQIYKQFYIQDIDINEYIDTTIINTNNYNTILNIDNKDRIGWKLIDMQWRQSQERYLSKQDPINKQIYIMIRRCYILGKYWQILLSSILSIQRGRNDNNSTTTTTTNDEKQQAQETLQIFCTWYFGEIITSTNTKINIDIFEENILQQQGETFNSIINTININYNEQYEYINTHDDFLQDINNKDIIIKRPTKQLEYWKIQYNTIKNTNDSITTNEIIKENIYIWWNKISQKCIILPEAYYCLERLKQYRRIFKESDKQLCTIPNVINTHEYQYKLYKMVRQQKRNGIYEDKYIILYNLQQYGLRQYIIQKFILYIIRLYQWQWRTTTMNRQYNEIDKEDICLYNQISVIYRVSLGNDDLNILSIEDSIDLSNELLKESIKESIGDKEKKLWEWIKKRNTIEKEYTITIDDKIQNETLRLQLQVLYNYMQNQINNISTNILLNDNTNQILSKYQLSTQDEDKLHKYINQYQKQQCRRLSINENTISQEERVRLTLFIKIFIDIKFCDLTLRDITEVQQILSLPIQSGLSSPLQELINKLPFNYITINQIQNILNIYKEQEIFKDNLSDININTIQDNNITTVSTTIPIINKIQKNLKILERRKRQKIDTIININRKRNIIDNDTTIITSINTNETIINTNNNIQSSELIEEWYTNVREELQEDLIELKCQSIEQNNLLNINNDITLQNELQNWKDCILDININNIQKFTIKKQRWEQPQSKTLQIQIQCYNELYEYIINNNVLLNSKEDNKITSIQQWLSKDILFKDEKLEKLLQENWYILWLKESYIQNKNININNKYIKEYNTQNDGIRLQNIIRNKKILIKYEIMIEKIIKNQEEKILQSNEWIRLQRLYISKKIKNECSELLNEEKCYILEVDNNKPIKIIDDNKLWDWLQQQYSSLLECETIEEGHAMYLAPAISSLICHINDRYCVTPICPLPSRSVLQNASKQYDEQEKQHRYQQKSSVSIEKRHRKHRVSTILSQSQLQSQLQPQSQLQSQLQLQPQSQSQLQPQKQKQVKRQLQTQAQAQAQIQTEITTATLETPMIAESPHVWFLEESYDQKEVTCTNQQLWNVQVFLPYRMSISIISTCIRVQQRKLENTNDIYGTWSEQLSTILQNSTVDSSAADSSTADNSTADNSTADSSTADNSTVINSTADSSTIINSTADNSTADNSTADSKIKNSNRKYCYCREEKDESMVECDGCNEWFHLSCQNQYTEIFKEQIFQCLECSMKRGIEYWYRDLWDSSKIKYGPNLHIQINLLNENKKKNLYKTIEIVYLFDLIKESLDWINKLEKILYTITIDNKYKQEINIQYTPYIYKNNNKTLITQWSNLQLHIIQGYEINQYDTKIVSIQDLIKEYTLRRTNFVEKLYNKFILKIDNETDIFPAWYMNIIDLDTYVLSKTIHHNKVIPSSSSSSVDITRKIIPSNFLNNNDKMIGTIEIFYAQLAQIYVNINIKKQIMNGSVLNNINKIENEINTTQWITCISKRNKRNILEILTIQNSHNIQEERIKKLYNNIQNGQRNGHQQWENLEILRYYNDILKIYYNKSQKLPIEFIEREKLSKLIHQRQLCERQQETLLSGITITVLHMITEQHWLCINTYICIFTHQDDINTPDELTIHLEQILQNLELNKPLYPFYQYIQNFDWSDVWDWVKKSTELLEEQNNINDGNNINYIDDKIIWIIEKSEKIILNMCLWNQDIEVARQSPHDITQYIDKIQEWYERFGGLGSDIISQWIYTIIQIIDKSELSWRILQQSVLCTIDYDKRRRSGITTTTTTTTTTSTITEIDSITTINNTINIDNKPQTLDICHRLYNQKNSLCITWEIMILDIQVALAQLWESEARWRIDSCSSSEEFIEQLHISNLQILLDQELQQKVSYLTKPNCICKCIIDDTNNDTITCYLCKVKYHKICVNINKKYTNIDIYECPRCCEKNGKRYSQGYLSQYHKSPRGMYILEYNNIFNYSIYNTNNTKIYSLKYGQNRKYICMNINPIYISCNGDPRRQYWEELNWCQILRPTIQYIYIALISPLLYTVLTCDNSTKQISSSIVDNTIAYQLGYFTLNDINTIQYFYSTAYSLLSCNIDPYMQLQIQSTNNYTNIEEQNNIIINNIEKNTNEKIILVLQIYKDLLVTEIQYIRLGKLGFLTPDEGKLYLLYKELGIDDICTLTSIPIESLTKEQLYHLRMSFNSSIFSRFLQKHGNIITRSNIQQDHDTQIKQMCKENMVCSDHFLQNIQNPVFIESLLLKRIILVGYINDTNLLVTSATTADTVDTVATAATVTTTTITQQSISSIIHLNTSAIVKRIASALLPYQVSVLQYILPSSEPTQEQLITALANICGSRIIPLLITTILEETVKR